MIDGGHDGGGSSGGNNRRRFGGEQSKTTAEEKKKARRTRSIRQSSPTKRTERLHSSSRADSAIESRLSAPNSARKWPFFPFWNSDATKTAERRSVEIRRGGDGHIWWRSSRKLEIKKRTDTYAEMSLRTNEESRNVANGETKRTKRTERERVR